MSKPFTDKDYERAAAEAEEAVERLAALDLSAIKWPKRNRSEGASFEARDDISRLFSTWYPSKCSPASSRS